MINHRAGLLIASAVGATLWLACGTDAASIAPAGDSGADARSADAAPGDAGESEAAASDAADAVLVPAPCDPANDLCSGARKCCPVAGKSADGGPNFGCVLLKPPSDTCPAAN